MGKGMYSLTLSTNIFTCTHVSHIFLYDDDNLHITTEYPM